VNLGIGRCREADIPSGAKAPGYFTDFMYGLKPVPFTCCSMPSIHLLPHTLINRRVKRLFNVLLLDADLVIRFYGGVTSPFVSQSASQVWPSFQRKTWPLIRRQLRSMAAIARISSPVKGSDVTHSRFSR
jgi:hypothetical protein